MASTASFDVVSDYDLQAIRNAVDTAKKELLNRYDLKGKRASFELKEEKGKEEITIEAENAFYLNVLHEILQQKFGKQEVDLKVVDWNAKADDATQMSVRQHLLLKKGLTGEVAKNISKAIRENFPKAKASIQGDAIRVVSASRDELQAVQHFLRGEDWPAPLSFTNYR